MHLVFSNVAVSFSFLFLMFFDFFILRSLGQITYTHISPREYMSLQPKTVYRFNTIPIKIPIAGFFYINRKSQNL